jgi:hypothetical protein
MLLTIQSMSNHASFWNVFYNHAKKYLYVAIDIVWHVLFDNNDTLNHV